MSERKELWIRHDSVFAVIFFGLAIWFAISYMTAGGSWIDQLMGLICSFAGLALLIWGHLIAWTISIRLERCIFCSLTFQPFPHSNSRARFIG